MDLARICLLKPIPEIFHAAELLKAAAGAHLAGNRVEAARLFKAADMPAIWSWTDRIWGKHDPVILQVRDVSDAPPILPKEARIRLRMPSAKEQETLINHYGYKCAFCGIPLVHRRVRQRAVRLYPQTVTWGRTNRSQHAAFQAMWLQFDHVLPHARGGDNRMENLVITCAPCNFGRMNYTLDELGLADPRMRPIEKIDWNGLEHFE